jgi:hypothetical protein
MSISYKVLLIVKVCLQSCMNYGGKFNKLQQKSVPIQQKSIAFPGAYSGTMKNPPIPSDRNAGGVISGCIYLPTIPNLAADIRTNLGNDSDEFFSRWL